MKLTDDETKSAIEKINSLALEQVKCPVCGQDKWHLNSYIFETREFLHGKISFTEGVLVPYVTMSCENCSNTLFFNAVQLGIIDPESMGQEKEGGNHGD